MMIDVPYVSGILHATGLNQIAYYGTTIDTGIPLETDLMYKNKTEAFQRQGFFTSLFFNLIEIDRMLPILLFHNHIYMLKNISPATNSF